MHQSVRDAFVTVTAPIERMVNHMCCDNNRNVVTGIGIMLPDARSAQQLSWRWKDTNKRATAKEIAAEWQAIHYNGTLGLPGRSSAQYAPFTHLMLPNKEIFRTIHDKMNLAEYEAEAIFVGYRLWPADAQLAVLQLIHSETLTGDLVEVLWEPDFTGAAELITGVDPRSVLVKRLFNNAETVIEQGMNKSKLLPLAH